MGKFSDKEILVAIRSGEDHKVIPLLYKEILPGVSYWICKNNGSNDEAKDIFQDAILLFYRQVMEMTYNEDRYKIHGYIYIICRNLWINEAKKKNRMVRMDDEINIEIVQKENILDTMLNDEREAGIKEVFASLGTKCFELLSLTFFQKYSMREVAEKMDFPSENAAKTAHYRCKNKLMEIIEGNPNFEKLIRHEN